VPARYCYATDRSDDTAPFSITDHAQVGSPPRRNVHDPPSSIDVYQPNLAGLNVHHASVRNRIKGLA